MTDEMAGIHRELGKHDVRIESLENDRIEFKRSLAGMHEKINQIWAAVSKNDGTSEGQRSTWGNVATILNTIIAGSAVAAAFLAIYISRHP